MAIVRMQQRRDTALNWSTYNPVLRQGELGFDTNARKFKIGDGETDWNGLDYLLEDEVAAALAAQGAAEDAQAAAEAAAAEAEATAESVIPTTDAAMTAVAGNPTSAFAIQQSASFDATLLINRTQTMNLRKVVTPSGSNDTAAVNTALAAFASAGGGKVVIPRDGWKFTGSTGLALTGTSSPIHIEFEDDTVWDMTGSTASIGLLLGGSATATSAALGGDVSRGAESFTCATVAGVAVAGDILKISSTDYFETFSSQPKGELVEVLSVSGSTINIKGGLFDSYTAATTTVTLLQMPRVTVEGEARFLRNSNHQGIQVAYARDVTLGGLYGEGARERLFYLNHVFGATADNLKGRDFWYSGTGTSYGLVVAASQHVKEIGLDLRGGRHAVSHGGFVPCRDIQTIGGTFDNYHASGQKSFDYHGDCENLRIVGATILNGLNCQGSNLTVTAGTRIRSVAATPAVEIGQARSCDFIKFEGGVDIESASGQVGVFYTSRNGSNATTLGLLKIDATIRAGASGITLQPASSSDTGATISRLVIRGDVAASGNNAAVTVAKSTSAYIGIGEASLDGRFYTPGVANAVTMTGTSAGTAEFKGSFTSDGTNGRPIDCQMFGDVFVRQALLKGVSPFRAQFTNSGGLYLSETTFDGPFTNAFIASGGPTEVMQSNVRRINGAGAPLLPGRHFTRMNGAGKVVTYGTAAPTTGAWNVGDRCENTAPAVGSAKAWVCTVAGTPGTWVSEGNL